MANGSGDYSVLTTRFFPTPITNHRVFQDVKGTWAAKTGQPQSFRKQVAWPYFVGFGWPPSYPFANDKGRIGDYTAQLIGIIYNPQV